MDGHGPACCDVHAHFVPPELVAELRAGSAPHGMGLESAPGAPGQGEPFVVHSNGLRHRLDVELYDAQARAALMDQLSIDVAAVSVQPTLLYYSLPPDEGLDWCRRVNDEAAQLVRDMAGRAVGVATLPMQDSDAAVAEAERAVQTLGLSGVQIAPLIGDRPLDDPDFFAVLECLDRLNVPVILHPNLSENVSLPGLDKYGFVNTVGHPYQTALGASRLILSGVLDKLQRLRPVLVHGGGYLPYQIGRLDHAYKVRGQTARCQEKPSSYLRRFTFDTLTHSPDALDYLIRLVGADRVAYGTDFPLEMGGGTADEHLGDIELDQDQRTLIKGRNCAELFGVRAAA